MAGQPVVQRYGARMRTRRALGQWGAALVLAVTGLACSSTPTEIDGCGHDLSSVRTTVIAVDTNSGQIMWTRDDLPVASDGLTELVQGNVRLVVNKGQIFLDPRTGHTVDEQGPGAYVISIPPPGSDPTRIGPDGPPASDASNSYLVAGGTLVATDQAGRSQKWSIPLSRPGGSSTPILIDGLVIVSNSDQIPTCA